MVRGTKDIKLNKEQLVAIKYGKGPLLIIAGAGTGKTTVIAERIKYLILSKKAKPNEVLALTFTEKAAREMEERVDVAMPYGYTQMWISTFHSFCDRILRAEALHIGLDPRYKLMTEAETVQFLRNNLFAFNLDYFRPLGNPTKFIGGMLQHFSRLQDEDIGAKEYLVYAKKLKGVEKEEKKKNLELASAFKIYDELKIKEGLMDFGDLIVKTLALFRTRPNVLRQYQDQFKYILVDEFQDTNYAQNELAILLAGKNGNITAVADDDQAVYRWRGASVSNVIQFKKNFPRAKVVVLTRNYRSTQEILDRAYELIQHNNPDRLEAVEKIDKKLSSQKGLRGEEIGFIHTDRVENEADAVARKIEEIKKETKYEWRDFAILVRANNHSEPFARAFSRRGIPYQFLGPGRLFKQPEVIDLISYLKVIYNFDDSVALYRLLSIEYLDIPARDLVAIGNYARRFNLTFFEACEKIDGIFISSETKEKIKKILEIIGRHLKIARRETAGQLLYYFLQDTGLLQKLLSPDSPEAEKKAGNISKFFDKLKTYEVDHEDATVPAVVDWLELSSELGESPRAADTDWTEVNAVNILTAHSSKGLEFPVVFLVNLVTQRFPTTERREQIPIPDALIKEVLPIGDYHLEEERRLFYVGMTRARDILYLTAADYYGEGKREKRLSPFIFESLGEGAVASELLAVAHKQLTFLDYAAPKIPKTKYQIPKLHIDYLSFSQIETFKTCPLHYKLKYILKVPTPPSAAQSFGSSLHAAIRDFYLAVKAGGKPTEKFIYGLLEKNWVKEGFSGKAHEKKFFEKGKLYLSGFLKQGFNPKSLPVVMEEPFTIPLNDKKGRGIRIGGKIDRVDVLPDGTIEIIDYKTGATIPSQAEVDNNLQLSFYALAATSIPNRPFGVSPEQTKLSLYFLDQQEKISTIRSADELRKATKEIFEIREEIEKSDFKCSGHIFCQNKCEYSLLCQVQP